MELKNRLGQEYLYRSVMTASPAELIVMLFDACIKDVKLAAMALEEKHDLMKANTYFVKAQKIIAELMSSLDMDVEISGQLLPIYEFMLHTLMHANVQKDTSALPGVIEILTAQRDTWKQIAQPNRAAQGMPEVMCG
ncbi:MAG: flagellar export chaperone FliS [Ruminococcaceae bacterium]|nr:flagellar export chaperone FliS [Oscillospiraceae bacterium]